MKKRNGFVSNSSSSSFIIKTSALTEEQFVEIISHSAHKKYGKPEDSWNIYFSETEKYIIGETSMDNWKMDDFCFDRNITVRFFGDEYGASQYIKNIAGQKEEDPDEILRFEAMDKNMSLQDYCEYKAMREN